MIPTYFPMRTALAASLLAASLLVTSSACAHRQPEQQTTTMIQRSEMRAVVSSVPTDPSSVAIDVPLPSDSGECTVRQNPVGVGRMVTLHIPTAKEPTALTTLLVDSRGEIASYSDRRGRIKLTAPPRTMPDQLDSLWASARRAERSTTIAVDFRMERAIVSNEGGGRPDSNYLLGLAQIAGDARFAAPGRRARAILARCDVPSFDRGPVTR